MKITSRIIMALLMLLAAAAGVRAQEPAAGAAQPAAVRPSEQQPARERETSELFKTPAPPSMAGGLSIQSLRQEETKALLEVLCAIYDYRNLLKKDEAAEKLNEVFAALDKPFDRFDYSYSESYCFIPDGFGGELAIFSNADIDAGSAWNVLEWQLYVLNGDVLSDVQKKIKNRQYICTDAAGDFAAPYFYIGIFLSIVLVSAVIIMFRRDKKREIKYLSLKILGMYAICFFIIISFIVKIDGFNETNKKQYNNDVAVILEKHTSYCCSADRVEEMVQYYEKKLAEEGTGGAR